MRYSSRREAVLAAVQSTRSHPDAEWVYERVRQSLPNVSLGTVYRNLKSLCDAGELCTVETESGALHYDAFTHPHAHFVCRACGKIADLDVCGRYNDACAAAGHKVQAEKTVLYGVCADCSRHDPA